MLREARDLGAVQLGFSGGEPLMRDDLETLVAEAQRLGYYTNLITSGVGPQRAADRGAQGGRARPHPAVVPGLDARDERLPVAARSTFELKRRVAKIIKEHGYPMVLNVVLHRMNIDHVDQIIDMAAELGAEYLELANTQYYGWAYAQPRVSCCRRASSSSAPRRSPTPSAPAWASA